MNLLFFSVCAISIQGRWILPLWFCWKKIMTVPYFFDIYEQIYVWFLPIALNDTVIILWILTYTEDHNYQPKKNQNVCLFFHKPMNRWMVVSCLNVLVFWIAVSYYFTFFLFKRDNMWFIGCENTRCSDNFLFLFCLLAQFLSVLFSTVWFHLH